LAAKEDDGSGGSSGGSDNGSGSEVEDEDTISYSCLIQLPNLKKKTT
jgi:hypothetical protein